MRTVEITLRCNESFHDFCARVGHDQVQSAIGYLSMWSFDTYDKVTIYADRDNDLVAVYYKGEKHGYTIGAVWREAECKYSFHS